MANGTRLARLKMLEDGGTSHHKSRKLEKLETTSSLKRKLETAVKKLPESPVRRSARMEKGGTSSHMNSQKCASPCVTKNQTGDGGIGPTNSSYINKSRSPTVKKRKDDSKSVSSSTDNCIGSDSPQSKRKKVEKNIVLEVDKKSEDNGKKMVRKHLHIRAYKRMIAKHANKGEHANKGGNAGTNICMEAQDSGDKGSEKVNFEDKREQCNETLLPSNKGESENTVLTAALVSLSPLIDVIKEYETEFCVGNNGQQNHNSNYGTVVESSKRGIANHDCLETNKELFCTALENPGLYGGKASNRDCRITTNQQVAEENINVCTSEPAVDYETSTAFTHNLCLTCKQPGHLMCCYGRGCKRRYHPSCLDPPANDVLPGAWLCKFCVKKKMDLGVYSVSEGIESVWGVKEGVQCGKHYFVKYKGLGHVHNRWISESQLLDEAPLLLAKFRKKSHKEKVKWRKEWSQPERLLLRRFVVPPEVADEHISVSAPEASQCWIEWFVKWRMLEYDRATWESETSLLSHSPEAARLIEDYERRRELARRSSDPMRADKLQTLARANIAPQPIMIVLMMFPVRSKEVGLAVFKASVVKEDHFCKLSELPVGCSAELDNSHLTAINCLREFWCKSVNAVFIDDQERFTRSVLFALSLQSHSYGPFLIITTTSSLPLWLAEFAHLAPSLNVVMYQGDKHVRRLLQNLEFYEESGCLMFQVLVADSEAIIEDLDYMTCIGWDTIIVDKCQNWKMSGHLEQLKCLNAHFKLVLLNGQLKDSLSEYRNILSFINVVGVNDDLLGLNFVPNEGASALAAMKLKLARHIAYECKVESSKFLEYWVPVPFSNVQLEQYCAFFVSNSSILRSNSKSEVVGALHSILIDARKCCDHPYLVDGGLRGLLTRGFQGAELLNAEVCLSGKLFLLDKILQEMKIRGLRVVILFQSLGGPGKISLGDILDDFLQQRFGVDSYERIETGLVMTKKLAALNMFNSKESGRFVFLIEKRACLPSVKLSSVDVIILFDSDWNPLNDLRSLQKMSIESPHSSILLFRLHTSFTVEEKLLVLAKEDTLLDSDVQNISRSSAHSLLGWGASHLFYKLDQFHSSGRPTCISEPSFDKVHLDDVISDIFSVLPGNDVTTRAVSVLIKAQQVGATYSRNIILIGEKEGISFPKKDLPKFWSGLLIGRHPRWIYISERSPRVRKKVQNLDGLVKTREIKSSELKKKHQEIKSSKLVKKHQVKRCEFKKKYHKISSLEQSVACECPQEKRGATNDVHKDSMLESDGGTPKLEEQRNLLMLLRPELSELCDILALPDPVKDMAQEFLVYIMNNHDVSSKQVTVLQALMISLCWRAASISKHSLQRIGSLALAKRLMKFECSIEEARSVYSRLRILKKKFRHGAGTHVGCKFSEQLIPARQGHDLILEDPIKPYLDTRSVKKKILENQVDLVEEAYLKRSKEPTHMHDTEVSQFDEAMPVERVKLKKAHDFDATTIEGFKISSRPSNEIEGYHEVPSIILNGREEREGSIRLPDEAIVSSSGTVESLGTIERSRLSMEPLVLPCVEGLLPIYSEVAIAHSEVSPLSRDPANLITDSIAVAAVDAGQRECRGNSNERHLLLNSVMNEGACHSSLLNAVINEGAASTSSSQELYSNEHSKSAVAVTSGNSQAMCPDEINVQERDSPHIELLPEHEQERPPTSIYQEVGCSELLFSTQCSGIPEQEKIMDAIVENEPPNLQSAEDIMHSLRTDQEPIGEVQSAIDLRGDGIQQVSLVQSFSSTRGIEVPAQQIIVDAATDNEPSCQQTSENAINPLRLQEDLPLQRTTTGDMLRYSFQPGLENQFQQTFPLMGWVPPQAICADPFKNELFRICRQVDSYNKKHEEKKAQLHLECEQEIEKVKRKYNDLIEDAERAYIHDKKMLQTLYDKVYLHKVLAEELRTKFYDHKEAATSFQGSSQILSQQLQASHPQPQPPPRTSSVAPPVAHSTASLHSPMATMILNNSSRPRPTIPAMASTHSTAASSQIPSLFPTVTVRGPTSRISSPFGRAPAPHLQRARSHVSDSSSNSQLTSANCQLPLPSSFSIPTSSLSPSGPSIDLGSSLPATLPSQQPSIFPTSQPASSGPSPGNGLANQIELPHIGVDLLESLLSSFPLSDNAFPASAVPNLGTNNSHDVICLSDDE